MSEPGSPESIELWRGIGQAFFSAFVFGGGAALLGAGLMSISPGSTLANLLAGVGIFLFFGFGIAQLAWIWPIAAHYKHSKQNAARAKGLWIGAAVIALLQGGCYGVVFLSMSSASFH